jgi:hypothetical protein
VALAVIQASGSPNDNTVNANNFHDQAQQLEALIRSHSR